MFHLLQDEEMFLVDFAMAFTKMMTTGAPLKSLEKTADPECI